MQRICRQVGPTRRGRAQTRDAHAHASEYGFAACNGHARANEHGLRCNGCCLFPRRFLAARWIFVER